MLLITILLALPALADDPLTTVPELVGARVRAEVPVDIQPGATCEVVPAVRATVHRGDAVVLTVGNIDANWTIDGGAPRVATAGQAELGPDLSVGTHTVCVQRDGAAARIALEVVPPPYTQVALAEVNPDGTARTRSISAKIVEGAPIVSTSWMNSDFVHLDRFQDGTGRDLHVTVAHDERRRIYSYDATLVEPVPVGDSLVLDTRGLAEAKGYRLTAPDTVTFQRNHSPNVGTPTRRIEVFRLPAGAVVTEAADFTVRQRDGRTELVRQVTVPANGSITTAFTYTLAGASGLIVAPPAVVVTSPANGATDVDPSTREIRVTFNRDMADGSWSWVQMSEATYPKSTGAPAYADPKTCVLPVKLKPGTEYVVWINRGQYDSFRDTAGTPAEPFELRFRTSAK